MAKSGLAGLIPWDGGREAILTDVSRADDFAIRFILDVFRMLERNFELQVISIFEGKLHSHATCNVNKGLTSPI